MYGKLVKLGSYVGSTFGKELGPIDAAIEYLKKALGTDNNEFNAQVQYEIAEALEDKGDIAAAAEEYLKIPRLYSKGTFWSVKAKLKSAQLLEKPEIPNK